MEERYKTPRIFKGREDSERKELNSLSPVDSYKINNQKSNYPSGERNK